jgi:hypothetical protein
MTYDIEVVIPKRIKELEDKVIELQTMLGTFMNTYDRHTHYKGLEFVSSTDPPSQKSNGLASYSRGSGGPR